MLQAAPPQLFSPTPFEAGVSVGNGALASRLQRSGTELRERPIGDSLLTIWLVEEK
jgi:hypothetical protein